jgi:hypothetical protein
MPSLESAAVVARTISRTLRKAGFPMSDTSDRFRWTEGFHVHRVGYSRDVGIGYHVLHSDRYRPEHRGRMRDQLGKARAFLESNGYVFEGGAGLYIKCKSD